jgi:hypothetical protein
MTSLESSPGWHCTQTASASFEPLGARRLFLLGGIGLILVGMLFGDIFAVFVLHQNAAKVGANLARAAHAALAGNSFAVQTNFQNVGKFLENRGTKVDTHVHMTGFGYLALLLALVEPWIALTPRAKRGIAWIFLVGAGLLPVGVFLIHYVGLVYSPFESIGWASIAADFGGFLVMIATLACLAGLWRNFRSPARERVTDGLIALQDPVGRLLLAGGILLVLLGFLGGGYYAAVDLYSHEARDFDDLSQMSLAAAARNPNAVDHALADYGQLQGEKAVKMAAHAHAIEFGLLAMMLAFFQPFVNLRDVWKRRWALVLLLGSALLPFCVLLELRYGFLAGGLADFGGLLVVVPLLAMWIGILRRTGQWDAAASQPRRGIPA